MYTVDVCQQGVHVCISAAKKCERWRSMAHRLSRKRCLDQCLPPLVQHVHWQPSQGGGRRQAVAHADMRAMRVRMFCIPLCVYVCACECMVCMYMICTYIYTYICRQLCTLCRITHIYACMLVCIKACMHIIMYVR